MSRLNAGEAESSTDRWERRLLLISGLVIIAGATGLALCSRAPTICQTTFGIGWWPVLVLPHLACFAAAHIFLSRLLPNRDPLLLPTAALLTGLGLLMIGRLNTWFLMRQASWTTISTAALASVVWFSRDMRWLRRFRYTWLLGGLALLTLTLLLGVNPSGYGPRLWLGLGGVYIQPSEPLKLLMIVFLASYLSERAGLLVPEQRKQSWWLAPLAYVGPLLAMFGLAVVLLAWQQDLGAAMLFFFTFLAMLYLATDRWSYVAIGLLLFAAAGVAGSLLSARVALRVAGWLNPWPTAEGQSFQIVQSLIAVGAGGIFGQGLGLGSPYFIPAAHTDFTFAALGEELGLAGTLAIVALYAVLLSRGLRAALRAPGRFERFLAAGLTVALVVQAWIIMAGNVRGAPITGVTLPFVSYGGSSLLVSFFALGLLLRISHEAETRGAARQRAALPAWPTLFRLWSALLVALTSVAILCGYWVLARGTWLQARADNPRQVLAEQRIHRGRILDRQRNVLADVTVAANGEVSRRFLAPSAAPVLGYASLRYGTGGLEAAFDSHLRGDDGERDVDTLWREMRHAPRQGQDIQITLDRDLQRLAQESLMGQRGALVLLDAQSGEVLAMASSPTFDPGRLDERWETLADDPAAPLLNRATQGLYQPGAALQTVVLAEALIRGEVETDLAAPVIDAAQPVPVDGQRVGCAAEKSTPATWAEAYAAACPAPFASLGPRLDAAGLMSAFTRWRLTTPPLLEVPTEATEQPAMDELATASPTFLRQEAMGQGTLTVSPLRMALVAAGVANEGRMPAPRLVLRTQAADGAWMPLPPPGDAVDVLPADLAARLANAWEQDKDGIAGQSALAVAGEGQKPHAWFLGSSPQGARPCAIAVLLEHAGDPASAASIGRTLLRQASER